MAYGGGNRQPFARASVTWAYSAARLNSALNSSPKFLVSITAKILPHPGRIGDLFPMDGMVLSSVSLRLALPIWFLELDCAFQYLQARASEVVSEGGIRRLVVGSSLSASWSCTLAPGQAYCIMVYIERVRPELTLKSLTPWYNII